MSESSQKDMSEEEVISLCQKVEEDHRKMVKEKQQQQAISEEDHVNADVKKPSLENIMNEVLEEIEEEEKTMSEETKNTNVKEPTTYTAEQVAMLMSMANDMMNENDPWYKAQTGEHNIVQQIWYAGTGKSAKKRHTDGDTFCIRSFQLITGASLLYGTYRAGVYAYNTIFGDD